MTIEYDEFRAEQADIDDVLDDTRSPYEGEYPPQDYLDAEAKERAAWHREKDHGGRECDCPPAPITFDTEAPF